MDEKRSLEEVLTIYAFEPSLKDIFLEGRTDKNFVEWYLRANGARDVSVYPIELIDIPVHVIQKHGLAPGSNRSRVLAVACELAERYPAGLKVLCLADRDYEDYRPSVAANCYLVYTDCNSLDLYAFTPAAIDKFVTVALGGLPLCVVDLMDALNSVLQELYALRLVNELLKWGMKWIPFAKYVKVRKGVISFDEKGFVRATLQKNNRWQERSLFSDKVRETKKLLAQEAGRRTRAHDLSDLLLLIIRHMRKDRKYGNSETLEGSLMASLECRDLERLPFFQRILAMATMS
jgi:hypothetical protein